MKLLKLALATTIAISAATATDYKVELSSPAHVGATELKAGSYKVTVEGEKAVFKSGKTVVAESPATVKTGSEKYDDTALSISNSNLQAISVGGTNITIVLGK